MDRQNQKWVNLSYLFVAVLFAYIVFVVGQKIGAAYDLEVKVKNIDLIVRIVSLAFGAIAFGALFSNKRANHFMNEVVQELMRVTWPAQKETTNATIIVIVMVVISGLVLGLLDYLWTKLLQFVV
jgi:preprotein translocase SecE subunit